MTENHVFAEIITIGDEILYGQINDTNSQWLGAEMGRAGFKIMRKTSIGDNRLEIVTALKEALGRAQAVVFTGGLGPTKDDITKKTLAEYFGVALTFRPEVLANIETLFRQRGKEVNELNKGQAYVPENAEAIPNLLGTAPGMWFEVGGRVVVSMPGVPYEMKKMMAGWVIPRLKSLFPTPYIVHRVVKTIGIPESRLAMLLEGWEDQLPAHIKLAYLPRFGQVRLRLTGTGTSLPALEASLESEVAKLPAIIGKYIYAYGEEDLAETIGKLLSSRRATLAVAESCTGGMLAGQITAVAGCSDYFNGGVVAYSNAVKAGQLGVKTATLEAHGAVSEQTAMEMAENVRIRLGADYGLSTTGIAGPGGAVPGKPVGTVWIGFSSREKTYAKLLQLTTDRALNIEATYTAALNLLRKELEGVGIAPPVV